MPSQSPLGHTYRTLVDTLFRTPHHPLLSRLPEAQRLFGAFALGSMQGQAEKVSSGACAAFMIRPSFAWYAWACEAMAVITHHYGLGMQSSVRYGEIWGYENSVEDDILDLLADVRENSGEWHTRRGLLCGICDIDLQYHLREHWGERCEPDTGPTA